MTVLSIAESFDIYVIYIQIISSTSKGFHLFYITKHIPNFWEKHFKIKFDISCVIILSSPVSVPPPLILFLKKFLTRRLLPEPTCLPIIHFCYKSEKSLDLALRSHSTWPCVATTFYMTNYIRYIRLISIYIMHSHYIYWNQPYVSYIVGHIKCGSNTRPCMLEEAVNYKL